jgi:hypothetical protein
MVVFVANREMEKRMGLNEREKRSKQDDRKKGLEYVREVREILESLGYRVEGPGYSITWFYPKAEKLMPEEEKKEDEGNKRINPLPRQTHRDYFGAFDLISAKDGEIKCHQVSIIEEKSRKRWDILTSGIPGYFWGRFKEKRKVGYRVFHFSEKEEREINTYWLREHRENRAAEK